jgi:hypothetical protein
MIAEAASVSVVLVGKFQPDDFLPDKLVAGKILSRKLLDSLSFVSLIPGSHVQYKFAWAEVTAQRRRLQVTSSEAPYIRVCDFVLKALGDVARESVVAAFGINCESHYNLGTIAARNRLGLRLAPPEAWGGWGAKVKESIEGEPGETNLQGGVILLRMRLPFLKGSVRGWLDVSISPSDVITGQTGICLIANHHHQISTSASEAEETKDEPSESDVTSKLLESLSAGFDNSLSDTELVFKEVASS